jgi:hypothetical protein
MIECKVKPKKHWLRSRLFLNSCLPEGLSIPSPLLLFRIPRNCSSMEFGMKSPDSKKIFCMLPGIDKRKNSSVF